MSLASVSRCSQITRHCLVHDNLNLGLVKAVTLIRFVCQQDVLEPRERSRQRFDEQRRLRWFGFGRDSDAVGSGTGL